MPKDSQVDNKKARMEKSRGQTPLTAEAQNKSRNAKSNPSKGTTYSIRNPVPSERFFNPKKQVKEEKGICKTPGCWASGL